MKAKTWMVMVLCSVVILTTLLGLLNMVVDPFFHYHKPLGGLSYEFRNQNYINDGIARHFDYDAIITGTSMSECFLTSDYEEIFHGKAIKIPLNGERYHQITRLIRTGLEANHQIKRVLRSLDMAFAYINAKPEELRYESYPDYLYDDKLLNDVNYLLNKTTLLEGTLHTLVRTAKGIPMSTFDQYKNWSKSSVYGKEAILKDFTRRPWAKTESALSEETRSNVVANLQENIVKLAKDYPHVQFYLFFPPYSAVYWDDLMRGKKLEREFELYRLVIETLLPVENIKLFGWSDMPVITCTLDHYKDSGHYSGEINTYLMKFMAKDKGLLTAENYEGFLTRMEDLYRNYDYDGEIFAEKKGS